MAKRDIKVNYDSLAVVERQLKKQRNAIEKLRTAMGKVNSAASAGNTAQSIDGLKKRYKKAKKRLDDCYEEVDALYNLVHGYIRDMTGIIQPKRGMTRVGRNDIYMNLQSVMNGLADIWNVQSSHCLFLSSGIGKTEEEKKKMERNYEKLETQVWGRLFPKLRKMVEESSKTLQAYYDHEITDYENKDDEYKIVSEAVRHLYSSPWEIFKQYNIDKMNFAWSIIKGVGMAALDFLKGFYSIGNMLYYGISADVAAIVCLVSSDPPEWTEEVLGESEEYFGNIAKAVSHPVETVEAMAQSANDTYEKEGLTYMVSYVVADIVIGKAAAGEFSKAKTADKADDVADVAKVTNKADDVADVAKAADKADDVADVAGTTSKTDDIADAVGNSNNHYDDLDNLDDLEDFYDEVYDQYYKDQFDPVEEGVITEWNVENISSSIDDIIDSVENGNITLISNKQKGNYGEMKMDQYYQNLGYERVSVDKVTNLDAPIHQGIDGVYYNPNGHPPYVIGEAKYGGGHLSTLKDGTRQMSNKWIQDRLEIAVGTEKAKQITKELILNPDNVETSLIQVDFKGNITKSVLKNGRK